MPLEVLAEADIIVAFKRILDDTWICREWRDVDQVQPNEIILTWHRV